MKTKNLTSSISLVCLSAAGETNVAILAAEISQANSELVQLLPAGSFNAVDGRPADVPTKHWLLDQQAFEQLKANTPHQMGDLVIDYEHQTLKAETNGQPAPAAGYFNINDVEFVPGKGLFIKPRWTDKAKAALSGGEYKYISAVFGYDRNTGRPTFLHSAGLVNRPGVDGMAPLASLAAEQFNSNNPNPIGDNAMNEALIALLKALGISIDGKDLADPAVLSAVQAEAITALGAIQTTANQAEALTQQVAVLSAGNVDPAKYVPIAAVTELQTQVAALQAQMNGGEVDSLVSAGLADGRIIPAMESWARDLGKQDVAQLKAYLDKAAPIAALKGKQTDDTNVDDDNNDVTALSADDKYTADQLGMSYDDFAKEKAAEKGAK